MNFLHWYNDILGKTVCHYIKRRIS